MKLLQVLICSIVPHFSVSNLPPKTRGCRGPKSFPRKNVWFRPQIGQMMREKQVLPLLEHQDVRLAKLPLPDAPREKARHQGVLQAPEDEELPMKVYVG